MSSSLINKASAEFVKNNLSALNPGIVMNTSDYFDIKEDILPDLQYTNKMSLSGFFLYERIRNFDTAVVGIFDTGVISPLLQVVPNKYKTVMCQIFVESTALHNQMSVINISNGDKLMNLVVEDLIGIDRNIRWVSANLEDNHMPSCIPLIGRLRDLQRNINAVASMGFLFGYEL